MESSKESPITGDTISFFNRVKEALINPDKAPRFYGKIRERFKPNLDSVMRTGQQPRSKKRLVKIKISGLNLSELATRQGLPVHFEADAKHKNIFINYIK